MSKNSELIAARRVALGLTVISNDAAPARSTHTAALAPAPAPRRETVLDTSIAYANHCTDGQGITGSNFGAVSARSQSTVAPPPVARPSTTMLSLVE